MSVTEFRNCGPMCAEILGGHCPGATCVYRPTDEIPWHQFDSLETAELRGYRKGARVSQRAFLHGYKLGVASGAAGATIVLCAAWIAFEVLT